MDHSLLISDLHLCESRPEIIDAFISFLANTASKANALYILGDLFEYWAGDDAIAIGVHSKSINALKQLSLKGIDLFLIHGNRDFLLGDIFSQATNITILPDPSLIQLHGEPILIGHGDALCTDDIAYQQFKAEVRSKDWKIQFLSKPLTERIDFIESIRQKSEQEKSIKSMEIMDVNSAAVEKLLSAYSYPPKLIHGHTHRPMQHQHTINGHTCERWVLGDWYSQGSYLRVDTQGFHAYKL
ncbi:MAG: UDP-2,3-diacylglucosamine diphosphatase [Methylophilaceae bacterium]